MNRLSVAIVIAIALLGLPVSGFAAATDRLLVKEVTVNASLDEVWHAWTTAEGLTFISGESNVLLERGGPYEWFLDLPPDEYGKRGGQGARILAFLPKEMIAFSWTFPPSIPELRDANETTQVVVRFEPRDGAVFVRLVAHEWQEGEFWEAGYAYFDRAWESVLNALKAHFESRVASRSASAGRAAETESRYRARPAWSRVPRDRQIGCEWAAAHLAD